MLQPSMLRVILDDYRSLTSRLRNVLEMYPDGPGIMNEVTTAPCPLMLFLIHLVADDSECR